MSANTKIEWCDHTYNHWIGCNPISPGCANCYAADWAKRYGRDFAQRTRTKTAGDPVRWNRQADDFFAVNGRRQRVFCSSLSDVFDNQVPDEWRQDLANLILNTPNLDWLLLTKRIGNAGQMMGSMFLDGPPDNLWLGATIVNQEEADRDIPKLVRVPAAKRFLSIEPLLGRLDLERPMPGPDLAQGGGSFICQPWLIQSGIGWVIVGGESGHRARPMHPDWARDLRDQCESAGVPFLFKQWGEWAPNFPPCGAADSAPLQWIDGSNYVMRVGKKAAGRMLDGRTWDGFPS